jgi:Holliday junction resolvasome RuvABC endonuclease subunit
VTTPRVVGLDLSLSSTGFASRQLVRTVVPPKHVGLETERLVWIRNQVLALCIDHARPGLVALEGYSYNSKFSHAHKLGEFGGVVKVGLHEAGIGVVLVAPKVVKKYATGNGGASKQAVLVQAVKRTGIEFANDNESDAFVLRALVLDALGYPVLDVPKANREALKHLELPELASRQHRAAEPTEGGETTAVGEAGSGARVDASSREGSGQPRGSRTSPTSVVAS